MVTKPKTQIVKTQKLKQQQNSKSNCEEEEKLNSNYDN